VFVTLIDTPARIAQTDLAIGIGEMYFGSRDTCIVLAALVAALLSALSLWRIARSEDRQKRLLTVLRRTPHQITEPSRARTLLWYQRLGALVASTRIISTAEQRRLLGALIAAGVKGHGHLSAVMTAKVCGSAAFVPLCWLLLEWRHFFAGATTIRFLFLGGAAFLGWRCPDVVLSRLAARRRVRLEIGIPDALDLLVICAQAGLSLDHAIEQVGRVLRSSSPEVAEEFTATAAEMRVSAVRGQALENLAQRVAIASLRGIVAALNQSIKFGTPLTDALRVLAAEMRAERLARFEERAARLPVLLTLPLMGFILPSLMIVIGTPLVLRIIDMLGRAP
jgi:tight adherence protein C